jgi:WD40 repeat protein
MAAFSPDGTKVLTGGIDRTVRLWESATGRPIGAPIPLEGKPVDASFSPDGATILAADSKAVHLWATSGLKPLGAALEHWRPVKSAIFGPNGRFILTRSGEQVVCVWNASDGRALARPLAFQEPIEVLCCRPDGKLILTWGREMLAARLRDPTTFHTIGPPLCHRTPVLVAAFVDGGRVVVTVSEDRLVAFWQADTGQPIGDPRPFSDHGLAEDDRAQDVVPCRDTRFVLIRSAKHLRLFDARTGLPIGPQIAYRQSRPTPVPSPDGTKVVLLGTSSARLWDATRGRPIGKPLRHKSAIQYATFSPDGTKAATSDDETVRVWDPTTGQAIGDPVPHGRGWAPAVFSLDGRRLLVQGKRAQLCDVATGRPTGEPIRQGDRILAASFSPDNTKLLTAGADQTAQLRDAATGLAIGSPIILPTKGQIRAVSFSPDGTKALALSRSDLPERRLTAFVWDTVHSVLIGSIHETASECELGFSVDSQRIITLGSRVGHHHDETRDLNDHRFESGFHVLWNAATAQPMSGLVRRRRSNLGPVPGAGRASLNRDGTRVLTTSVEGASQLWDPMTARAIGDPIRHDPESEPASFSPDGRRVLTWVGPKSVRLWDASTSLPIGDPIGDLSTPSAVAFSPDGSRAATGGVDGAVRLWDTATGQPIGAIMRHQPGFASRVNWLEFSHDGARLLTCGAGGTLQLWDVATRRRLGELLRHQGASSYRREFDWSPDGNSIRMPASREEMCFWNLCQDRLVAGPLDPQSSVILVEFSPDGTIALTGANDGSVRLWNAVTGRLLGRPLPHNGRILRADFSRDGHMLMTYSFGRMGYDGAARLWDLTSDRTLREPVLYRDSVTSADLSPDGSRLFIASSQGLSSTIQSWDVATRRPAADSRHLGQVIVRIANSSDGKMLIVHSSHSSGVETHLLRVPGLESVGQPIFEQSGAGHITSQLSPDGRIIANSTTEGIRCWDAQNGEPKRLSLKARGSAKGAIVFHPNSRVLLVSHDNLAQLYDVTTGQALGMPMRHPARVAAFAFSPNGEILATACDDKTVRLWDTATCLQLGQSLVDDGVVNVLAFSPDGSRLLTGGNDGATMIWRMPGDLDGMDRDASLRVQLETGMRLDTDLGAQAIDTPTWQELRRTIERRRVQGPSVDHGITPEPVMAGEAP